MFSKIVSPGILSLEFGLLQEATIQIEPMTTSKHDPTNKPLKDYPLAASSGPGEQLGTIDSDLPKRHRLIELLISRHEELIEKRTQSFAAKYRGLEADAILSRFYWRLTQSCVKRNELLDLQDNDLNPIDQLKETKILSRLLRHSCIDELRRWKRHAYRSKSFSQMDDFKPDVIPSANHISTKTTTEEHPAVRLADRLAMLKIEVTDRQFNILLCRAEKTPENRTPTYDDIAHRLGISPTTVRRELGRVTEKVTQAKHGPSVEGSPSTTLRREDFRKLLQEQRAIPEDVKRFMEAYVELTSDGKRPTKRALCEALGINGNQLTNRQRRAAEFREGLLHVTR